MDLISKGLPAYGYYQSPYYGNSDQASQSAPLADDQDFTTDWVSSQGEPYAISPSNPAWLAYDISSVPAAHRKDVLAVWYNDSYSYDSTVAHFCCSNSLADYSIDVNAAPGGGHPPAASDPGWKSLYSVTGFTLKSHQQVLGDLSGYNWIRLYITASNGPPGTSWGWGAHLSQFDLYDLSATGGVATDDWIFFGDSVTAGAMDPNPEPNTTPGDPGYLGFATQIHQADPSRWPIQENGGIPGLYSWDGVSLLCTGKLQQANPCPTSGPVTTGYLGQFPGRYVALDFGMNDAGYGSQQFLDNFYTNMKTMALAVIHSGKIPVIPTINYANNPSFEANIPSYNAEIDKLYTDPNVGKYIVKGPDFFTYFQQHPTLINPNDVHPTPQGYEAMRQLWVQTMLAEVY